ncbi:MAG: ketoacyl-ACP synthase III [Clostridiales bacterium]|nr:ketoacyl-ACP synthase III [Clostridiales bacterium]
MSKAIGIVGIGSYVPDRIVTNYDLEKIMDTSNDWILERTGIERRRVADKDTASSDLGVKAAEAALADAGLSAEDIDLIITATLSPDMIFPSTACVIQEKIGAVNAAAFDLSAACTGFIYAITTAKAFIASGDAKKVLVIGTEAISKILNWEDRKTAVLFGDGAGAVVLAETEEGKGIITSVLGSDGTGNQLLYIPAGGTRMPASYETVDRKGHTIVMDGSEVFKFASRKMVEVSEEAVNKSGLTLQDIDCFLPHQANLRIIKNAAKRMGIPLEKVYINLHEYGNMSAASIPVALDEAVKNGHIKKGDIILMVGFGAGLTWGATVLEWNR